MKRIMIVAVGAAILALAALGIASAHATLDHCTPAPSATVATAPAQIVCIYSEEIDTKQSTMAVSDASGAQVDKKDAHVDLNDPDHKTLIVSLDPTLVKDGLYTVKWHAVTPDDNGISDGSWQFVVGSANATPYPPTIVVQGETPAAGASSAGATDTPATSASSTTAAPTAAPSASAALPQPTSPAATATTEAPAMAPSTGAGINPVWIVVALLAAVVVIGGILVWVTR